MSIALERSPDSSPATAMFPAGGGTAGGCYGSFEVPEIAGKEVEPLPPPPTAAPGEESCSSSSIGRDSDHAGPGGRSDEGESGEAEVQSRLKGPLETMDALDDSLPMRRGISKFYCGKSKSFASLGNVISSSMKDLAKPEDPYTRKRKNLLASSIISEGPYCNKRSCIEDAIPKRPKFSRLMNTSVASSSSCSNSNSSEEEPGTGCLLPPPHPKGKSIGVAPAPASRFLSREKFPFSMRSFSLTDLHGGISLHSGIPSTDKAQK